MDGCVFGNVFAGFEADRVFSLSRKHQSTSIVIKGASRIELVDVSNVCVHMVNCCRIWVPEYDWLFDVPERRCRACLAVKIWSEHIRSRSTDAFISRFGLEFGLSEEWVLVTGCNNCVDSRSSIPAPNWTMVRFAADYLIDSAPKA